MEEVTMQVMLGYWVAAFLTICIFSFLYRDNPFYKFAEHLFVGVSAGYGVVLQFFDTLMPKLIEPLAAGPSENPWYIVPILALGLSLLMFTKFTSNFSWLARWPLAFVVGAFAGVNIIGFATGDLVIQVKASMVPLWGADIAWYQSFNNLLSVVGLACALLYFFFSRPHTGPLKVASRIGIYFMMISFGASFGYTVMGRLSLAIGRADELILESAKTPGAPWPGLISMVIVVGGLIVLSRMGHFDDPDDEQVA